MAFDKREVIHRALEQWARHEYRAPLERALGMQRGVKSEFDMLANLLSDVMDQTIEAMNNGEKLESSRIKRNDIVARLK
jgi:hypothetical protein